MIESTLAAPSAELATEEHLGCHGGELGTEAGRIRWGDLRGAGTSSGAMDCENSSADLGLRIQQRSDLFLHRRDRRMPRPW